jgi:hypothetical protein
MIERFSIRAEQLVEALLKLLDALSRSRSL